MRKTVTLETPERMMICVINRVQGKKAIMTDEDGQEWRYVNGTIFAGPNRVWVENVEDVNLALDDFAEARRVR